MSILAIGRSFELDTSCGLYIRFFGVELWAERIPAYTDGRPFTETWHDIGVFNWRLGRWQGSVERVVKGAGQSATVVA